MAPEGELDLVVRDGRALVVVEVKSGSTSSDARRWRPAMRVRRWSLERRWQAARRLARAAGRGTEARVDVVEVWAVGSLRQLHITRWRNLTDPGPLQDRDATGS